VDLKAGALALAQAALFLLLVRRRSTSGCWTKGFSQCRLCINSTDKVTVLVGGRGGGVGGGGGGGVG